MENAVHFIILAAEAVLSVVLPPLIMKIKHKKDICSSAMRTLSMIAAETAFLITGEGHGGLHRRNIRMRQMQQR